MKKIHEIKVQTALLKSKRVAAYARVSHSYLLGSLAQQVSYYNQYIQNHPEWEFVGVYVDEAISGKTIKARNEFKRLLTDCRQGKIDIILTKSISRFARNTVELLETVRELKNLGISIRFEKENIDTLTTDGELLLTLLGSIAQEEVSNISENMRWTIKKKFEKGEPHVKQPVFGYRWGVDSYIIVPDEAMIVKETFDMVQIEIAKRDVYAVQKNYYGKLQCSCCGGKYGVKTWHPGSQYMQRVYQCLKKYKLKCSTPTLKSKDINYAFIQAFNQVYQVKNEIIENVKLLIGIVSDTSELDRQLEIHSEKLLTIEKQVEELVMRNAKVVQNQDAYQTEYDSLCTAYATEKELYQGVQEKLLENQERVTQLKNFIISLKKQDKILESFDFELFHLLVDKVVVDNKLSFYFKEGAVVSI